VRKTLGALGAGIAPAPPREESWIIGILGYKKAVFSALEGRSWRVALDGGRANRPARVAQAPCVKTCIDGDNAGALCTNTMQCPLMGAGVGGNPFCRDRCRRCTPP